MLTPSFIPSIDRSSNDPLYMQIYEQLRRLILSGDLSVGSHLPPIRELASELSVSRITVSNAYQELFADGLVEGQVGRGTIVCGLPGDSTNRPLPWNEYFAAVSSVGQKDPIMREMLALSVDPSTISFACGVPASDLYPLKRWAQATHAALSRGAAALDMAPVEGVPEVRETMATWAAQSGIEASVDNIMMISGSQQGIDFVARALVGRGGTVVMAAPSYLGAVAAFDAVGGNIITVPVDHEGMRTDILDRVLARNHIQLIYTIPTFQNPTGTTLSMRRREELLALSQRYQVPILEDDPYHGLYYTNEPPPPPLKAMDKHGCVIYVSSFSKTLFPGIRSGWMVAPRPVMERLSAEKQHSDTFSSTLTQYSVQHFIEEGWLSQHLAQMRRWYPRRRDAMLAMLGEHIPEGLYWNKPNGGFYIWCKMREDLSSRELLSEAMPRGLVFAMGEVFFANPGGYNTFRLNFSSPSEEQIHQGIHVLSDAFNAIQEKHWKRGSGSSGTCTLV